MTDILTLWVDCANQTNRNALSGYQGSDLGEFGDNLVHRRSCIYPGPGFLDHTRQLVKIRSSGRRKFRQSINALNADPTTFPGHVIPEISRLSIAFSYVDALSKLASPTAACLYQLTSVIKKPWTWINATPAMNQIITKLSEIASLVPTQSISVRLVRAVYPKG